jgi:hypothetical protein
VLGGDEEVAAKAGFGRAAAQRFLRGDARNLGIVVLLGKMREDEIAGAGVEAIGVGEEFADGVIREMPCAGEDALLDDPRIRADLEHVEVVIGFEDEAVALAEMVLDKLGEVAEVGDERRLGPIGAEGEADGVCGIVRKRNGVDFDVPHGEPLAGLNRLDAAEALGEGVRENAVERVEGRFRDEQRRLPEGEKLWQAGAVVGVLVRDDDAVKAAEVDAGGGKARKRFALAESGVNEEARARSLEQRGVARAAGGKNGDAQADRFPRITANAISRMMAEGSGGVNALLRANPGLQGTISYVTVTEASRSTVPG